MSFLTGLLPYIEQMAPEAAFHHGILIGTMFGETFRKMYRSYLNRKQNRKDG